MLFSPVSCSQRAYTGAPVKLNVAYSPFESTGLLWVALDQGFFKDSGLDITITKYISGASSLDGVLNGEADISIGASEFPVVLRAFQGKPLTVIGNADKGDFIYLVGRKDRGIARPDDLKGKNIGVAQGTAAEFFASRYLQLNGINLTDVTLVDLKTPEEWVNAVRDGRIDAVVTAQPDAEKALAGLGDNGILLPVQSAQAVNGLVVASTDWLAANSDAATRFLRALIKAEEYVARESLKAKAIVQAGLNLDSSYVETAWRRNNYSVSLDQALVLAMEEEARWAISNNLSAGTDVPDFLDFINTRLLGSVKPEAVNIAGR